MGSKRFVGMHGGRGVMVESSKRVKPWREIVHAAALAARNGAEPLDAPLLVRMVFTMPKPASAPKTRTTYPCRMPDLSKLCRATEDALTTAGVWKDVEELRALRRSERVFVPERAQYECEEMYRGWKRAVGCSQGWIEKK